MIGILIDDEEQQLIDQMADLWDLEFARKARPYLHHLLTRVLFKGLPETASHVAWVVGYLNEVIRDELLLEEGDAGGQKP